MLEVVLFLMDVSVASSETPIAGKNPGILDACPFLSLAIDLTQLPAVEEKFALKPLAALKMFVLRFLPFLKITLITL